MKRGNTNFQKNFAFTKKSHIQKSLNNFVAVAQQDALGRMFNNGLVFHFITVKHLQSIIQIEFKLFFL